MASASIETPIIKPPPQVVVLRMSREEAATLKQVLGCVCGPPSGPRGQMDNIATALALAGVFRAGHQLDRMSNLANGVCFAA